MERDRSAGQKRAEEGVQAVQSRGGPFVAAVEATRMPMIVSDPSLPESPIIYANGAFLELVQYEREDLLGRNFGLMVAKDPEGGAHFDLRMAAAMSAQEALVEDIQFVRKDGSVIWVAAFISPVIDEGRVVQHFASFMEISHRVRLEADLRDARASLECRVAERTRRLEATNNRLQEEVERRTRMEAVLRDTLAQREDDLRYSAFLAREIDHRTKNALQMASSLLEIQARRSKDEAAEALLGARNRLLRIADVHALLYQESDADTVDFASYLERLVRDLGESYQPAPGQVRVTVDADEAIWRPDLVIPLGLIVGESIINAMKHAFPEGRPGLIAVTLHAVDGGLMRLTVEDDGVGMPEKRRTGALGLDLIERFARQIRGKAAVQDGRRGHGTRVIVTFPMPDGAMV